MTHGCNSKLPVALQHHLLEKPIRLPHSPSVDVRRMCKQEPMYHISEKNQSQSKMWSESHTSRHLPVLTCIFVRSVRESAKTRHWGWACPLQLRSPCSSTRASTKQIPNTGSVANPPSKSPTWRSAWVLREAAEGFLLCRTYMSFNLKPFMA